jgi:hypothetical protein
MRSLIALAAVLLPSVAFARSPIVDSAKNAYRRGSYDQVITILTSGSAQLAGRDDRVEAQYLLALAYMNSSPKRPDLAKSAFTALLYEDPDYTLDPDAEAPEVYALFSSTKQDNEQRLKELREKLRQEELKKLPIREITIETKIERRNPWGNFIPFGYGQFANGHRGKGTIFAISQGVFGGISFGLFAFQAVAYGIPSRIPPEDVDAVRTRQIVQIGTGGVFLLLYAWSVIDAFANEQPKTTETRRERSIQPEGARLTPYVGPDVVGLGASWEF